MNRINTDLEGRGLEIEGDTVKVFIKYFAASKILLGFEQIHNLIFGNQVLLLKKLNEVVDQVQKGDFIVEHFEHVREMFKSELGD